MINDDLPAQDGRRVVSLFSGIGGIERGLGTSGFETVMLCESWQPARKVLERWFDGVPIEHDVRELQHLPDADVLTAGFPCSDLSQAGRMAGISGDQSGLVSEVFRLLRRSTIPTVLLENVRNMVSLHRGAAMRYVTKEFEELGYQWAYRVVDSRFAGLPQRRQRVIFIASTELDPRSVLLGDDAGEPDPSRYNDDAYGFYWTEGLRGLGWARDATPALKNGSTIGLASPPAIWNTKGDVGRRILTPRIEDGERLQGFPAGWTTPADEECRRPGTRWRLVGNAVTVNVARWVGRRLAYPASGVYKGRPHEDGESWPLAAYGSSGRVHSVAVSMWPRHYEYKHLAEKVVLGQAQPLSRRATTGFHRRVTNSNLTFAPGFKADIKAHLEAMAS